MNSARRPLTPGFVSCSALIGVLFLSTHLATHPCSHLSIHLTTHMITHQRDYSSLPGCVHRSFLTLKPHWHSIAAPPNPSHRTAQACAIVLRVVKSRQPLLQTAKLLYRLSKDGSHDALFRREGLLEPLVHTVHIMVASVRGIYNPSNMHEVRGAVLGHMGATVAVGLR